MNILNRILNRIRPRRAPLADQLPDLVRLTNPSTSTPNINELWRLSNDVRALKLSVKYFGYELSKALVAAMPPLPAGGPFHSDLQSKPATQADLEANWSRYWSAQLKDAHLIRRRVWDHAFVLQALQQLGRIHADARGLGFNCAGQPIPAYLAAKGCRITALERAPETALTEIRARLYRSSLIDTATFERNITARQHDVFAVPNDLRDFDFCWSVDTLPRCGSIENAMRFVEDSVETLRTGGVAVHICEFNFANDAETIDNWPTVLLQTRHLTEIAGRLERKGCRVMPLNFDVGSDPLDRFIDMAPFAGEDGTPNSWKRDVAHLKLSIDGFLSTSFGIIAQKH